MYHRSLIALAALLILIPVGCDDKDAASSDRQSANAPLADDLRALVKQHVQAQRDKDVDAVLATIHPQSPQRPKRELAATMLTRGDTVIEPDYDQMVVYGADDEYATARIPQRMMGTDRSTGQRREVTSNVLLVFRKDGEQWKYYLTLLLQAELSDNQPTTAPQSLIIQPPAAAGSNGPQTQPN